MFSKIYFLKTAWDINAYDAYICGENFEMR